MKMQDAKSVMRLISLEVESISYKKRTLSPGEKPFNRFGKSKEIVSDHSFRMRLLFEAETKEYQLSIVLVAEFHTDDEYEKIFDNNALAIMFPYMRTQVSLITTQPGIVPILLPVMNINQLFKRDNRTVK